MRRAEAEEASAARLFLPFRGDPAAGPRTSCGLRPLAPASGSGRGSGDGLEAAQGLEDGVGAGYALEIDASAADAGELDAADAVAVALERANSVNGGAGKLFAPDVAVRLAQSDVERVRLEIVFDVHD